MKRSSTRVAFLLTAILIAPLGCRDKAREEQDAATIAQLRASLNECRAQSELAALLRAGEAVTLDQGFKVQLDMADWDAARAALAPAVQALTLDVVQLRDAEGKVRVELGKRLDDGKLLAKARAQLGAPRAGKPLAHAQGSYAVAVFAIDSFGKPVGELALARNFGPAVVP